MARLFLSTDDDAPVLAGNNQACIGNLLKKCLIEGYGGRRPVGGWTMPYADAAGTKTCFRNDHDGNGLGMFLQITGIGHANIDYQIVQAWENMTSEDEGVFPFYQQANTMYIGYSGTVKPWALVATRTWLFLCLYTNGSPVGARTQNCYGFWFGDIEPFHPSDAHHCMLSIMSMSHLYGFGWVVANSSGSYTTATKVGGNDKSVYSEGYWFPRRSNGSGSPVGHYAYLPHPGALANGRFGAQGITYDPAGPLLAAKVALNDAAAYTLRGWIPDMLVPLHPTPFTYLERVRIEDADWVCLIFQGGQALFRLDAGE